MDKFCFTERLAHQARCGHVAGYQHIPAGERLLNSGYNLSVERDHLLAEAVIFQIAGIGQERRRVDDVAARVRVAARHARHNVGMLGGPLFNADARRQPRLHILRACRPVKQQRQA